MGPCSPGDPDPGTLFAVGSEGSALGCFASCCFVSTWICRVSLAASCSVQQGPQPVLPQLNSGDQEREKERFLENREEGKQFPAFEIQEVLILLLLMVLFMFKRAVGTLGVDGLS